MNLAQKIENAVSYLEDDSPTKQRSSRSKYRYSCNALLQAGVDACLVDLVAPEMLETQAPFADVVSNKQQARAIWLTFLAELAERGELTEEGLK